MKKANFYLGAGMLALVGIGFFLYKALVLGLPMYPKEYVAVWNLQAKVLFTATGKPVKATLAVPGSTTRLSLHNEHFVSRGFGFNVTSDAQGQRRIVWTRREPKGSFELFYRAQAVRVRTKAAKWKGAAPAPAAHGYKGAALAAATSLAARAKAKSTDLESLLAQVAALVQQTPPRPEMIVLAGKSSLSARRKAAIAARLLCMNGVAARPVGGVRLGPERRTARLHYWLEVFVKDRWRGFSLDPGKPWVAREFFPWWRGYERLLKVEGADKAKAVISVSPSRSLAMGVRVLGQQVAHPFWFRFSLFSLPLDTQAVYKILLLLPLGALVLVLLRNFIGLVTFGTFMPVLIAISFRETRLLWGLFLFCLVVGLGLVARLYVERLKLLVVPRLAAVLTLVLLIMAALSVMGHQLGIAGGLSVALFPMVILTMTIERMSIVWEERGPREALKQAAGSLLAASVAYLVMNLDLVGHLVFVFPELLLVVLALTLIMGRYTGYRLLELRRFKVLARRDK